MPDSVTPQRPPDSDNAAAAALARRDRERNVAAQAEIAALRRRIEELERSPSRRALAPVRQVIHAVAPAIRFARRLGRPLPPPSPPTPAPSASRGLALVIDSDWPVPDRDSGSVDIVNLVVNLRQLGFEAILAAAKQHLGGQPARDRLQAQGIRCLQPADAASVEQFIVQHGAGVDLCVLCRVYCGGELLELTQRHCSRARFVFDTIDLNYLREERKARLLADAGLQALIQQVRAREEHVIRSCDATLVVSQAELELLGQTMPDCLVVQMPLARAVQPPVTSFDARTGIGFIGGFAHAANVDAIRYFLAEIWPLVHRDLPECGLTIVGADAPADLLDGVAGPVRLLGHLPEVGPWFESLRLTVAPIRYGAGAKGKVASSLAAGVPCILTSVASEGMSLAEAAGVVVADTAAEFAGAVVRTYGDAATWRRLSDGGLAYAASTLSPTAWQARLDAVLRRIGF